MNGVNKKIKKEEENFKKTKQWLEEEDQNSQIKIDKIREEYLTTQSEMSAKEKNLKNIKTQREKIKLELYEVREKKNCKVFFSRVFIH